MGHLLDREEAEALIIVLEDGLIGVVVALPGLGARGSGAGGAAVGLHLKAFSKGDRLAAGAVDLAASRISCRSDLQGLKARRQGPSGRPTEGVAWFFVLLRRGRGGA